MKLYRANRMEKVRPCTRMEMFMKARISKASVRAMVCTRFLMVRSTMENGSKTNSMAVEHIIL